MAFDKSKVLKSAEKFVATGKIPQAIEEYQKILKENPKDWNLMIQIGDLHLKVSKTAEAIDYFQKVADHYYSDGFFLKAIAIFKRINKLDPSLTDICMKLADLYLKQGLTMDAKSQLQVVAHHYLSKNQNKEAIQTLQKLIEIEPDNLRTRNELAKAYKSENMIPEAIQEYMEISDQLINKNLLKESIAVLETAYKLDPKNTEVLRKILKIYSEQKDPAKALALIEEAVKTDPTNPELLALLAESYGGENQFNKAHEAIDRAIGNAAQKEPLWELKGDIYLKSGELEHAFSQYCLVVEKEIQRKDIDNSLNLLEKITQADSSFYPAWQKLVDLYTMLRQNANLFSACGSLADAYIAKKMYREAEDCLEKLIALDPEDSQHQEKLKFVRTFLEKPKPTTKPQVKEYEAEAEVSREVSSQDFPVSLTSETLSSVPSFEREPAKAPTRTVPQQAKAPATQPVAAKVITPPAAATAATAEEEKAFTSEHLIEAEVFNKYGLVDKAIEQLHLIISKYPHSTGARQKLKEIYLEKGDRNKAVDECVTMSRIFKKQGDMDLVEDLLSEARQINPNHPALEKAYRELSIPIKEMPVAARGVPATAKAAPTAAKEPAALLGAAPTAKEKPLAAKVPLPGPQVPSAKGIPTAAKAVKEMPTPAKGTDALGEIERLAQSIKTQSGSFRIKPVAPPPSPPPRPAPAPTPPPVEEEVPEIEIEIEEPEVAIKTPQGAAILEETAFEEFDFFAGQGLIREAARLLEAIKEKHPNDPGVLRRLAKLQEEVPTVPAEPAKIAGEISISSEEEITIVLDEEGLLQSPDMSPLQNVETGEVAESEDLGDLALKMEEPVEPLMPVMEETATVEEEVTIGVPEAEDVRFTEFAELEDSSGVEEGKAPEKEAEEVSLEQSLSDAVDAVFLAKEEPVKEEAEAEQAEEEEVKTHVKEELFEEEDDFFDLAAELEEGLLNVQSAVEDERPPDGQSYSLEDILTDFKKGVEKQLSIEDYDTRYNLGIAYKEMGLIDEAIAEFQIAAKDPKRFLECCSMLGLCFVEKGMHKLAIKWYQRGLDTPGYSEEEYQGLRFELAQSFEALGEIQKAVEVYQDVYGSNANYRNVAKKVKELQELLKKK